MEHEVIVDNNGIRLKGGPVMNLEETRELIRELAEAVDLLENHLENEQDPEYLNPRCDMGGANTVR